MNFNNYTIKSQEALNKATEIATTRGQQVIETGHLLQAILESDENLISFLFKKRSKNLSPNLAIDFSILLMLTISVPILMQNYTIG